MLADPMPTHDPYLWLEDDSAATRAWCAEQQAHTAAQLDADPRFAALAEEVLEHLRDDERVPFVEAHAGWWHHFLQSPAHPRGVYRRIRPDDYRANRDAWEVLFDLDALAAAEGVDWHLAGIDHCTERPARCLLSLSADGGDAACLREYDLDARAFVAEGFQLPPGKHSVTWRDPDSLYAAVVLSDADATASGYPREVRLWQRGQPFAQASSLLKAERNALAVSAWRMLNPDGGAPVDIIEEALSFYRTRYWRVLPDLSRQPLPLPPKVDIDGVVAGQLIVRLNQPWGELDAGVLLALDWQALCAGEIDPLPLFTPGPRQSVDGALAGRSCLFVHVLDEGVSQLWVFTPTADGWQAQRAPLPGQGQLEMVDQPWQSNGLLFGYDDFLTPSTLYWLDADDVPLAPQVLRGQPPRFAAEQMQAQLRHAIAPDGERIPYFVVARRDAPHDGQRPTLLYGYGGFAVPMTPFYLGALGRQWLELGGVFVLSCIRGGGEFGPDWHEAALAERRQVAFDDFLAIARQLIADGLTCPARLGIQGGSNGGLLVAAAMTQAPELFGAVVCEVPLTDMLRYTELSAGPSWIDEYGDPADPEHYAALAAYSPYQRLQAGVRYPATLVTTSSSDDRVHPGHARKFTARLRELGQPVLLYQSDAGGHSGQGGDMRQLAAEVARVTVFLYQQLMDAA